MRISGEERREDEFEREQGWGVEVVGESGVRGAGRRGPCVFTERYIIVAGETKQSVQNQYSFSTLSLTRPSKAVRAI